MKTVAIGLLGPSLDRGTNPTRWEHWRPTVGLCQQEDLLVDRLELLYPRRYTTLATTVAADVAAVSPTTEVVHRHIEFDDPWDFEEVYGALHDFARGYAFDEDAEDYLVHISTGTHVAQICLFLLTEARYLPARLVQTSPATGKHRDPAGTHTVIDLDLSRYDHIAMRFRQEKQDDIARLKSGIATRNRDFNSLIERIERVAALSDDPMLLMGPTGAGKSLLARRVHELKRTRTKLAGPFVEVNCATLRGDMALSTLFGHRKGAFTGATQDRQGLLREAHDGLLFLDEIGELGLDEQAMLLRAIEEKRFFPMGADKEVESNFQLICGTNRDLGRAVGDGAFRDDLLARINLWTFALPGLRDRPEDIEPNLQYEVDRFIERKGSFVRFNAEARQRFLDFATSPDALWTGNFRDLNSAVVRMATLATGGRVTVDVVDDELGRLRDDWHAGAPDDEDEALTDLLGSEGVAKLDLFDRVQLAEVVRVCRRSRSLSDAGRRLFAVSRTQKKQPNDADRLRKYLARYGLEWEGIGNAPDD